MATATLNWTPVGNVYSINQTVYYKALHDANWALLATVGPTVNTASAPGLSDNVIYQFKVRNNCVGGTNSYSNMWELVNIICPTPVNITQGETDAAFNFVHVGGDVSSYLVELLSSADVVLNSQTFSPPASNVTGSFTGLTPSTDYKIRVTSKATGDLGDHIAVCGSVSFRTNDVVCNPPTSVSATLS
jgi:hypothetical protein